MRLGLGTVQFGQDYGISNSLGKTRGKEVEKILAFAGSHEIKILDTAPAYGNSEKILGSILSRNAPFSIVTKTPKFENASITKLEAESVEATLLRSLKRLRCDRVYGLLIHDANNLLTCGSELLFAKMTDLKERGLVRKIGFSAYSPDQVKQILTRFPFDIVQLPFNVFDQRMKSEGCLELLKLRGVEVHARSVFLQGLLLMQPDRLPKYFARVRPHFERYHQYVSGRHLSPVHAALGFALATKELDVVLCGVTRLQELMTITSKVSLPFNGDRIQEFALEDPSIVNPSCWTV